MLKTLKKIVQAVSSAENLQLAMQTMVTQIRRVFCTEACTIYLLDNHSAEYVMMATDGLNADAVGKIRVSTAQGLLGVVGQREEPLNLDEANSHPKFYYHPEAGEDLYKAFLGVPIIHQRRLYGVLTVQQAKKRKYDESEEAFLVTISAQVAAIFARAEAQGELGELLSRFALSQSLGEISLGGVAAVPGIVIGEAVLIYPPADIRAVPERVTDDPVFEIELLQSAIRDTKIEIRQLREKLALQLPASELALFDAYVMMLEDASLEKEMIALINEQHYQAQTALRLTIHKHKLAFEQFDDDYLKERATDILDLGRRILSHIQAKDPKKVEYADNTILVGEEITPAALADVPEGKLRGIVSAKGSSNSHVAILARSLGVPTVMGAKGAYFPDLAQKTLIVDGYFGQVYVEPSEDLLAEFEGLVQEEAELEAELSDLLKKPSVTPDDKKYKLYVNAGLASDASRALSVDAMGIGLYRTEVPFMSRDRFPSEEEQRVIYQQILQAFTPRPVIMRTLDVGGDKNLPYFPIQDDNPFMGWRGIRVSLDQPEIFLMQVRAMMAANQGQNNLSIMLPMITCVAEVDEALQLINQAHNELVETTPELPMPPVGVMIEVPSAVYQAKEIATRVDFVSVGSNDLIQYLLAVDRNNARVSSLYENLHPAVLRALMQIVDGVHSEGKTVSICGEMASDPCAVILLMAMGFDVLSMNSTSLLRVKWVIRNFSQSEARKLLTEVLDYQDPSLIRLHLERVLEAKGMGGLFRAGKH